MNLYNLTNTSYNQQQKLESITLNNPQFIRGIACAQYLSVVLYRDGTLAIWGQFTNDTPDFSTPFYISYFTTHTLVHNIACIKDRIYVCCETDVYQIYMQYNTSLSFGSDVLWKDGSGHCILVQTIDQQAKPNIYTKVTTGLNTYFIHCGMLSIILFVVRAILTSQLYRV
jgi:hypothetical protein